ncbi:MAG: TIGR01244 family phosphatase [Alcanivoracaceae bacterium]|nr:TIGR01244 family phosphatase [Alcanivoracaceae bacterium]
MHYPKLSSTLTVAPQIRPDDLEAIAAAGYKTVINNRPDGEEMGQPRAATMAAKAASLGMQYFHQPVVGGAISDQDIEDFEQLVANAEKPVFAYCRTGTRCTVLWALSEAGKQSPEMLVNRAAEAGYDLNGLLPRLISRWQDQHG